MQPLRDRPIRQRLTFVIVLVSSIVLFLACAGLFVFQVFTIKRNFVHELGVIGEVVANTTAAATTPGDRGEANRMLAGLRVMPQIIGAAIVAPDGSHLADYRRARDFEGGWPLAAADGAHISGNRVVIVQPLAHGGERVGKLFLTADFETVFAHLVELDVTIFALALASSLLLAVALSSRFQRLITDPIMRLARTAQRIAKDKDYAVRADSVVGEEVGALTDAFNQMLDQIQSQDGALQAAQLELRKKVRALQYENSERKSAEAAQARLTAILEATPDFISSANTTGRILYLNRAARRMLGLQDDADVSAMKISDFHPGWAARIISTEGLPGAIHAGSWAGETALRQANGNEIHVSQVIIAHKSSHGAVEYFSTVMRDITERRDAEEALRISQNKLLETSRLAGMAEVATGVLHNVGNVLNSVNVSAGLVVEKLRRSKVSKLGKAAVLLDEHKADLTEYLTSDPNGQKLPGYLAKLGEYLTLENAEILSELAQLLRNIEHIKEVVAMQQSYAKVSGVFESLPADRLVEDAISMNVGAFERHGVVAERNFTDVPPVRVDRHKVLQILINLIRNAKYALDDSERADKRIALSILPGDNNTVRIVIEDNGIGISAENLTRVFAHGFTTRKDGHGFGLHSGALAAKEMGGSLSAYSPGIGRGATFTLELPIAPLPPHP